MNSESVQAWLDGYLEAWRTYDASQIGDLFSDDDVYAHSPLIGPFCVKSTDSSV